VHLPLPTHHLTTAPTPTTLHARDVWRAAGQVLKTTRCLHTTPHTRGTLGPTTATAGKTLACRTPPSLPHFIPGLLLQGLTHLPRHCTTSRLPALPVRPPPHTTLAATAALLPFYPFRMHYTPPPFSTSTWTPARRARAQRRALPTWSHYLGNRRRFYAHFRRCAAALLPACGSFRTLQRHGAPHTVPGNTYYNSTLPLYCTLRHAMPHHPYPHPPTPPPPHPTPHPLPPRVRMRWALNHFCMDGLRGTCPARLHTPAAACPPPDVAPPFATRNTLPPRLPLAYCNCTLPAHCACLLRLSPAFAPQLLRTPCCGLMHTLPLRHACWTGPPRLRTSAASRRALAYNTSSHATAYRCYRAWFGSTCMPNIFTACRCHRLPAYRLLALCRMLCAPAACNATYYTYMPACYRCLDSALACLHAPLPACSDTTAHTLLPCYLPCLLFGLRLYHALPTAARHACLRLPAGSMTCRPSRLPRLPPRYRGPSTTYAHTRYTAARTLLCAYCLPYYRLALTLCITTRHMTRILHFLVIPLVHA